MFGQRGISFAYIIFGGLLFAAIAFLFLTSVILKDYSSQSGFQYGSGQITTLQSGQQLYTNSYGAYEFQYPKDWGVVGAYGVGGLTDFVYLGKIKPGEAPEEQSKNPILITLEQTKDTASINNYNIPGLGDGQNAFFIKDANSETLIFKMHGLNYHLVANLVEAGKESVDVDSVFQYIVKTLKISSDQSTCKEPKLVPLGNFPDNFTLSNYHDSDGTDNVESIYPLTKKKASAQEIQDHSAGTLRYFLVDYVKDGFPFVPDNKFIVAPINSVSSPGVADKEGTGILHLNCIDTEDDVPGKNQPFVISQDTNNPFAIQIFGSAENPQALWSQEKWNINLLKQTRSTVYIKRGAAWQKYSTKNYYATMPSAFGG